jgi:hypothetical protein
MQDAIKQYGLVDLSTYLPKRPTAEQLSIIYEMFQDSLDGEFYDPARFAQHYKPYGFDAGATEDPVDVEGKMTRPAAAPVSRPAPAPAVSMPVVEEEEDPPFDPDPPKTVVREAPKSETTGKSPQEILAMLRNRNKA